MRISKIEYVWEDFEGDRQLKITLSNGTVISACNDGWGRWTQWGGTKEELYLTMPLVQKHNGWLNGKKLPWE